MAFVPGIEIVKAGEPYTPDSVEMLCIHCPLADCDEASRHCLIRIARRRDPKLSHTMYYRDRRADPVFSEKDKAKKRRYYERKKERERAQQLAANEPASGGAEGEDAAGS